MKPSFKLLVLTLFCLPMPGQISVPKIGTVRYPDGSFHTVQGLPANMLVADLPLDSAEAASFSDTGGLVAQNGFIRLLGPGFAVLGEYPILEKPLLAMDGDLTSALAWLPATHRLLHWNGSRFDAFELSESDVDGKVTDLQWSTSREARLLVLHRDDSVSGVSVSLRTGNLITSELLPGVQGYAVYQSLFVLYAARAELVADNLRGYRRSLALPASDLTIERMSNNWLHLYSASLRRHWALHVTQGDMHLSLLPGLPEQHAISALDLSATRRVQ